MTEIPGQQRLDFSQAVRDSLIDGLRLSPRQAHCLKTLDRLMRDEQGEPNVLTLKDDLGNLTIELVLAALSLAMRCSNDTARRAYTQLDALPYLSVESIAGRPHLFTVHWPAIVDDSVRPAPLVGAVSASQARQLKGAKLVAAKVARGSTDFARGSNAATPPGGVAARSRCMTDAILKSEQQILSDAAPCDPSQTAATPPAPSRSGWEVAVEQLRDLAVVEAVLIPRALATFRLKDCEATRDGILAAACCALKGTAPPKLFTFLVKRRAWECSGLHGIAELHFDEVRSWRRQRAGQQSLADATYLGRLEGERDEYTRGMSADAEFERHRAAMIAQVRAAGLGRGP